MENKQIKELMVAMKGSEISHLHIKNGTFEIEMKRELASYLSNQSLTDESDLGEDRQSFKNRSNTALPKSADMTVAMQNPELANKSEEKGNFVTSPMVGTFYSSPSPDEPPFVKVGDVIEKGAVVCIIEAMKVMNEIKSQVSGTVMEIEIESGQPVEFGSKIFRIR